MIKVIITKQGNYPVSAVKIRKIIKKTLLENHFTSDATVSVAIVGKVKMEDLVKKYYKNRLGVEPRNYMHPVLTFPGNETKGEFVNPPDKFINLGEIILSFKAIIDRSNKEDKLVDQVACELAEHGTLHLLGIHHG